MMKRSPIWTKREFALLKDSYESNVPLERIAEMLNRTVSAVRTRSAIMKYRRPGRYGKSQIDSLLKEAEGHGLDTDSLPRNPSSLRIALLLATHSVVSIQDLDRILGITSSTRNKAIQVLRSRGSLFLDDFVSPGEVALTDKAFKERVPLNLRRPITCPKDLPLHEEFEKTIDYWLVKVCICQEAREAFRAFLLRQLENARSEDISIADFLAIFSRIKPENAL